MRVWFGMYLDNGIVISARNGTTSNVRVRWIFVSVAALAEIKLRCGRGC